MAFDGKEGEIVSLNDAARWTANYRIENAGGVKAHFVGKSHLNTILSQAGCMGVRIYYGIDDHGNKVVVLVGATEDQSDMTGGAIVERNFPCPPYCPESSPLMG